MPMMYDPDKGTYRMKPMKIGDDIHNSDRCPPGKKFNLRLGKCIPINGMVGPDGTVTVVADDREWTPPDNPADDANPSPPPAPPQSGDQSPDAAVGAERAKRAKAKIMASQKGSK